MCDDERNESGNNKYMWFECNLNIFVGKYESTLYAYIFASITNDRVHIVIAGSGSL